MMGHSFFNEITSMSIFLSFQSHALATVFYGEQTYIANSN